MSPESMRDAALMCLMEMLGEDTAPTVRAKAAELILKYTAIPKSEEVVEDTRDMDDLFSKLLPDCI